MTRKIKLADLQAAVDEAYEKFRNDQDGSIDESVKGVDPDTFGIAVVLTDGTVISKGAVKTALPMGDIFKVPLHSVLLSQMSADELASKSGKCPCSWVGGKKPQKPAVPLSPHGLRAVSAIQPSGDPEGKWDIISDRMIGLMGSSPVLDDALYEATKKAAADAKTEDTLAAADYYLYDDAPIAIDLYAKGASMLASAEQLATMCATIAADGVNPVTKAEVFDGSAAAPLVSVLATKGPHKMTAPWNLRAGLPAKSSKSGIIAGVLPGAFGIAAVAPKINPVGVSVKAAQALVYIMQKLQLSVFASARVEFEK